MNKNYTLVIVSISALIFISLSCRKPIENEYSEYIGNWYSSNTTIRIKADGTGSYSSSRGIGNQDVSGNVKITDSMLKIGLKQLNIDLKPAEDSCYSMYYDYYTDSYIEDTVSYLYMILDGETFNNEQDICMN